MGCGEDLAGDTELRLWIWAEGGPCRWGMLRKPRLGRGGLGSVPGGHDSVGSARSEFSRVSQFSLP